MNKKGFTLQELLITLAIVGVIAAITAPALVNTLPDENKMKYLKAYNTLTNITCDIMDDPSLYWVDIRNGQFGQQTTKGLANQSQPTVQPYNNDANCTGSTKFPCIFSKFVNTQGAPNYNRPLGLVLNDTTTFTTTDGTFWEFQTPKALGGAVLNPTTTVDITINIKPNDENAEHNCIFDNADCKKPNQFVFKIDNDGGVYPADALGMAYVLNATKTKSSKEDWEIATNIVEEAESFDDFDKLQTAFNTIVSNKESTTEENQ